jgi:DNA-binding response OmpR family regulator
MDVPEAMDHLRRPGVAAAILDMLFVNSAGRSGLDLLQFIRGDPLLADLPVIILTGFHLNRHVIAQVEGDRAEMWVKPINLAQLTRRLGELVRTATE